MKKKSSLLAVLLQAFYLLLITSPVLTSLIFLVCGHWWLLSQPSSLFMIALKFNCLFEAILVSNFYLFYLVLFPRFIKTQQLKKFVLSGIVVILFSLGLGALLVNSMPFPFSVIKSFGIQFANISISIIINPLYPCGIAGITSWVAERYQRQKMEKINLETELALLKAQINPHFLFNTLNNIDILIEKDAKTASIYLKKLSGILRFMLYESPAEKIELSKEVEYIHKYIELQKIRTSNADFVRFTVTGDMDKLQIAPMLFIPFIENAFKHCTNKKISNAIEITIAEHDNEIDFTCSNAFDQSAMPTQGHSGLGLELIRNRLNLLYKNHQLNIDKTNDRFNLALTIKPDDN